MTKLRWILILSILAAVLLSANLALAKGGWGKIEISGDGLSGVVEITDPVLLEGFSLGAFQDLALGSIDPPLVIGSGYQMRRGWDSGPVIFVPFDEVHYYPDPSGGAGYLYYDGLVNGSSEFDGNWYRVTPTGEAVMQQFLAAQDVQPDLTDVPARVLSGHTEAVTLLVWSPDGSRLASSAGWWDSNDYGVRLWSPDGKLVKTLYGHSDPVQAINWSPDSTRLATGSNDGVIRLWDADGERIDTIEASKGIVLDLSWSPDGETLVSISMDETGLDTIQQWAIDGTLLDTTTSDTGSTFLKVVWLTDDDYMLAGGLGYHEPNAEGKQVFTPRKCQSCTPYWGF
ncbi:MAG: hypothetical protein K8I30_19050, partial [Anaerolineae bacterium]|nr:hypothetical protein [Anaerolineae bacterium]